MDSMYQQLRSLPLFQGIATERISELVEHIPFHFLKFRPGETIVSAGEQCQYLRFVVSGRVRIISESVALKIKLSHTLHAPEVLGPECLFGIDNSYPFTALAHSHCGILQLRKSDYVKALQTDKILLFNILNYLSSNHQRHTIALRIMSHGSIKERLAREITNLTSQRSTDVKVQFTQKDLCSLLGAQRNSLITVLKQMDEEGLIEYANNEISVKSIRALYDVFAHPKS